MSAISSVLVPGCLALASNSRNGGTTAYKTGYHGPRNWLKVHHPNDDSIQLPIDKLGPGDTGSAFDWTFPDAQAGNFSTIAKFSRRLYEAGKDKDPRTYPMRFFQGNIDSDRTVEGWSYYRDNAITTSDTSHLWHIHFGIWRKYINDAAAMRSILSILEGDDDMAVSDDDARKIADEVAKRDGNIRNKDSSGNVIFDPKAGDYISLANAVYQMGLDLRTLKSKLS